MLSSSMIHESITDETAADRPFVKAAEDSDEKPVVTLAENADDKPVVTLAEDSDGKHVVTLAEDSDDKPVVTRAEDSDDKPVVTLAEDSADKPAVTPAEDSADKPVVTPAEDSAVKPVVTLAEDSADKPAVAPAEDSANKPAVTPTEDHAYANKKSTRASTKKQKQYLSATVLVMLVGGIGGFTWWLDAQGHEAGKRTSASNSKISQSVLSGFGQLTQSLRSIPGCQTLFASKEASVKSHEVSKPLTKDLALKDEEASQTTYEVSKPLVKDITLNDEYVCQIRAIQHIEIRSLEKGYLQNVLVDEGDTVRKGQLLFQIKPSVYEADVQKSEAEVELSKIELENNQALVAKDIISPTEAAMSAAKLNKVKAELELAQTHLGFTEIRAPFDGLIGRFGDIRLGSLLEENQLLTTLSDMHKLWVYFNVPEAVYLDYMKNKRLSQNVQLELANKEIYPEAGTIEVIQSDFSSTSGNIAFRASFSNPQALLRYGQTGKILWPKKTNQAVIVPQKSTFEILDKRFIFVVDKTGVIHEREIKVAREEPNIYIVSSGITPDEMFLLERQNKLDKGNKIRYKLIDPQNAIENLKLYAE